MSKRDETRDETRDVTKNQFVETLRRIADSLESDERMRIQVHGERVEIPSRALLSIEHERDGNEEEIELQLRWTPE